MVAESTLVRHARAMRRTTAVVVVGRRGTMSQRKHFDYGRRIDYEREMSFTRSEATACTHRKIHPMDKPIQMDLARGSARAVRGERPEQNA